MSDVTIEYADVLIEGHRERVPIRRCKEEKCKAAMIWTTGPKGGRLPVDAAPDPKAPYVLLWDKREGARKADIEAAYAAKDAPPQARHASHFTTCPAARKFSRKSKPKQDRYVDGPTQPERAEMKCPQCGAVFANANVEARCGECLASEGKVVALVRA